MIGYRGSANLYVHAPSMDDDAVAGSFLSTSGTTLGRLLLQHWSATNSTPQPNPAGIAGVCRFSPLFLFEDSITHRIHLFVRQRGDRSARKSFINPFLVPLGIQSGVDFQRSLKPRQHLLVQAPEIYFSLFLQLSVKFRRKILNCYSRHNATI